MLPPFAASGKVLCFNAGNPTGRIPFMKRALLCLALLLPAGLLSAQEPHYAKGDGIDAAVTINDAVGSSVSLLGLLAEHPEDLHVLFIFGGGDLGAAQPGHLWCPDSFEDTHILRTLHDKYAEQGVQFIPVAVPPAYHSQVLGQPARVFLDAEVGSEALVMARQAFIESTLAARTLGILPVDPWFDLRMGLMLNRTESMLPGPAYGDVAAWAGAFRAAGETQFYGVPSFWILSGDGQVLVEPFRGNIYHPHGGDVDIRYTFADIDAALQALLVVAQ
jgi:hypothetical protein